MFISRNLSKFSFIYLISFLNLLHNLFLPMPIVILLWPFPNSCFLQIIIYLFHIPFLGFCKVIRIFILKPIFHPSSIKDSNQISPYETIKFDLVLLDLGLASIISCSWFAIFSFLELAYIFHFEEFTLKVMTEVLLRGWVILGKGFIGGLSRDLCSLFLLAR